MRTFLKDCRWGRFLLIEGDLISQYVDRLGHWCDVEVDLFRTLLPPETGVCIEVGANIGMHTVPLARLCARGEVICYEPQRPVFHVLCANIALNNLLNVRTHRAGVGGAVGRIEIECGDYETPWNYGSFSISQGFSNEGSYGGAVRKEWVDIVALDTDPALADLAALDLLKIDAEGHEVPVLEGARGLIERFRPKLFVEPGSVGNVDRIAAIMAGHGYRGYWFASSRRTADDPPPPPGAAARDYDVNLVFVPQEAEPLPLRPLLGGHELAEGVPIIARYP